MIITPLRWAGLWAVVIASAVIGRIIDGREDSPEVEEDPSLAKELALEWSQEFFRPTFARSSHFEHSDAEDSEGLHREQRRFGHGDAAFAVPEKAKVTTAAKVKVDNLEWMLRNIFAYPRSHSTNFTAKEIVKKYIAESFEYTSGLPTAIQYFKPQQFLAVYEEEDTLPVGANIIGILKGSTWSTTEDRPTVVGAHWDTVNFTPGTDDNGSGVAAMLEAARAIAHSGCKPKYSVIFVAFDLEETGSQGSLVFIKEYLVNLLTTANLTKEMSLANFQGAFIMDTIMNFNDSDGSQTFPTDWSLLLPEVYDEIANDNYRGDFLSVIHRKTVDGHLVSKFKRHWLNAPEPKFKIRPFPLLLQEDLPEMETLSANLNFLRSDHARFWYMNDTEVPRTLSAVLITDTGPYRGTMRDCYHTVCDGPEISVYDNVNNLKFLEKATQALVDTLTEMSECNAIDNRVQDATSREYAKENELLLKATSVGNGAILSDSPFHDLTKLIKRFQLL